MSWPDDCYGLIRRRAPQFRFVAQDPGARALRTLLPGLLRPGLRVLDIACGQGIGACHLAAAGARDADYLGIDPDATAGRTAAEVLAALPPGRLRGRVVTATIQAHLATGPDPGDLVLWTYALHECVSAPTPEAVAALARAVASLVAPEGSIVVGDPFIARGASATEVAAIHAYGRHVAGRSDGGKPFVEPEAIAAGFVGAGLALHERRDVPLYALAAYHRLGHARFALQVFGRDHGAAAGPGRR
jgi:2-polyprenyl-3-methyl-5-hydroxy-6-metoxy-1,4-benzoquinol methylase